MKNIFSIILLFFSVLLIAQPNFSQMGEDITKQVLSREQLFQSKSGKVAYFFGNSIPKDEYFHADTLTRTSYLFRVATNQAHVWNYSVNGQGEENFPVASVPQYNADLHSWILIKYNEKSIGSMTRDTAFYKLHVKNAIDSCKKRGWSVNDIMLCSPIYITYEGFTSYVNSGGGTRDQLNDVRTRQFFTATKNLSDSLGTIFVDYYNPIKADTVKYLGDGLHLSVEGSKIIAKNIVARLKGLQGYTDSIYSNYQPLILTPDGIFATSGFLPLKDTANAFNAIRQSTTIPFASITATILDTMSKLEAPISETIWATEAFNGYATTYTNNNNFSTVLSGTGTTATTVAPNATQFFTVCMQLSTGTTATGLAHFGIASAGTSNIRFPFNSSAHIFQCEMVIPTLSTITDSFDVQAGFYDNVTVGGSNTDAIQFYYRHDVNGGNWNLITRSSSTETVTNTGIAVTANTKYKLKIVCKVGGKVDAYIGGVKVASDIATNVPTAASRLYGYGCKITKLGGTTARTLQIDNVQIKTD